MFDIGWSEMAVVALIALVVIGPKELPKAMRSLAKWTRKARSLAREFQSGIDDMVREADLDDARKAIESAKSFDVGKAVEETVDPSGGLRDEAKELEGEMAREATGEDAGDGAGAPEDAGDAAGDEGDAAGGATVVEHPLNIAPPDSLTPPPEPEATILKPEPEAAPPPEPEPVAATADGDGSKQRA
jgi:sec-independent protein translocase protein TatB